jgi:hypothetical protein
MPPRIGRPASTLSQALTKGRATIPITSIAMTIDPIGYAPAQAPAQASSASAAVNAGRGA